MSFGKVDAGSGITWLTDAVNLVLKNPAAFLVMGLILGVINIIPILGSLAMTIFGPALIGGLIYAAREESEGRKVEIAHLFRAFQEPGKLGPMVLLCLPAIVGGAILLVLVFVFGVGALLGGGLSAASGSEFGWGAFGGGVVVLVVLGVAIGFAIYAMQFFAVPRVMLEGVEPFAAMKDSFSACIANIGAFLLFGIVVAVAFLVLGVVLAFIPILGWLALMTVGSAVIGCAGFFAWRQVYGGGYANRMPPPSPEVPPPPA